jgi:hypothetical protein
VTIPVIYLRAQLYVLVMTQKRPSLTHVYKSLASPHSAIRRMHNLS